MFLTKDKTLYALVIHKIRLGCVWLRRGGRGACEMIVEERDQHIERQLVQWRKFKTRAESQSANTGRPVHRTRRWTQQSLMRFALIIRSTFLINSWTVISFKWLQILFVFKLNIQNYIGVWGRLECFIWEKGNDDDMTTTVRLAAETEISKTEVVTKTSLSLLISEKYFQLEKHQASGYYCW